MTLFVENLAGEGGFIPPEAGTLSPSQNRGGQVRILR